MTHPGDCEADAASAALAPYRPGTAARVAVIPVTQVGVQGSQLDRNCRIYRKRVWLGGIQDLMMATFSFGGDGDKCVFVCAARTCLCPTLVEAMHERFTHTRTYTRTWIIACTCDQHVLCRWAFVAHLRIAWVTASRSTWSRWWRCGAQLGGG